MLEAEGRTWVRGALSEEALRTLDAACGRLDGPGQRLLLAPPEALNEFARQLLPNARPVRVIAFDKT